MEVVLDNLTQAENIIEDILPLKEILENKINLSRQLGQGKSVILTLNKVMRICLIASLNLTDKRSVDNLSDIQLSKTSQRIQPSFFTKDNKRSLFSALLKLRYKDCDVDWRNSRTVARIVAQEIYRGLKYLMEDNNLNSFLYAETRGGRSTDTVPALQLLIGEYSDNVEATFDINGRSVTNAQIIIAGSTGSGKTNLLKVIIQQFRNISTDSPYPVNFLLFDYKGEFSDIANNSWLALFDVDRSSILDPVKEPLPFSPFKDFSGRPLNEINLYSTEMANALCAIDRGVLSANMSNRLSEAIVNAYKETQGKPITFELMLKEYQALMQNADKDDSISSILKQLVRNRLFEDSDKVCLTDECFIVDMHQFPKDGPIAKAIVYFVISKLNNIYDQLPRQVVSEDCVQIRHFTIIDEAHYMLDFDNKPLQRLIAVGRDKGLSIILATQNMDQFKSKHFDFYANAQYPLIMKQQSIADGVIKDLFGVSGREFQEIKSEITSLQKGELIIKDTTLAGLGLSGKNYKKIKVTHLI